MFFQRSVILCLFISAAFFCSAQTHFEITKAKLGRIKIHRIFTGETFRYKKKNDLFFRRQTIVHMQDSLLVFKNQGSVNIYDLKKVGIERNVHLLETTEKFFIMCGVGFFALNTVNNVITDNPPVINWTAAAIGGALVGFSQVFQLMQINRVRITKNTNLKIVTFNYDQLNSGR
jgi:hypothetical protein